MRSPYQIARVRGVLVATNFRQIILESQGVAPATAPVVMLTVPGVPVNMGVAAVPVNAGVTGVPENVGAYVLTLTVSTYVSSAHENEPDDACGLVCVLLPQNASASPAEKVLLLVKVDSTVLSPIAVSIGPVTLTRIAPFFITLPVKTVSPAPMYEHWVAMHSIVTEPLRGALK